MTLGLARVLRTPSERLPPSTTPSGARASTPSQVAMLPPSSPSLPLILAGLTKLATARAGSGTCPSQSKSLRRQSTQALARRHLGPFPWPIGRLHSQNMTSWTRNSCFSTRLSKVSPRRPLSTASTLRSGASRSCELAGPPRAIRTPTGQRRWL